jgi:hypothetical protein
MVHYITHIESNCCVMFTECHVIQFILHCLIANIKYSSAQKTCELSLGTDHCQSTNC